MEQIRSADVLANFPQVDEEKLNAALAAEAAASNRKIIVLDDDPTGVQTVHDIYVYTDWTVESLRKGFAAPEKLFFILTNSRGFTVAETTKAHREIAENTAKTNELLRSINIQNKSYKQLSQEAKRLQRELDNTVKALEPERYAELSDQLEDVKKTDE